MRNRTLLPLLDGLLVVAMGAAALVAGLMLLFTVIDGTVSELPIGLAEAEITEALPAGLDIEEARAVVEAKTSLGYRLLWWLVGPASGLLVVWGAQILREIVASARKGDPFVAANVRRLRFVAWLVLAHAVVALARVPVALVIQNDLGVDHAFASADGFQIGFAIVLFALAEIWQRGVALREDQELTV